MRAYFSKIFEGEMIVRTRHTTPLQIFSEILLYSLDISKSFEDPDNCAISKHVC